MSETIDLQVCEHCSNEFPIQTMRSMSDCWFCEACTDEFQKNFDSCDHSWSAHTDEMGDAGRYCDRCSGFVRDEDFPMLFPDHFTAAKAAPTRS